KAIVAVAHSILVIAYHVLRDGQPYRELGSDYFERLNADRLTRYHTKRLAALGYTVTLTKCAALRPAPAPIYVGSAAICVPPQGSGYTAFTLTDGTARVPVIAWGTQQIGMGDV